MSAPDTNEDRFGGIFFLFVIVFTLVIMVGGC